MVIDVPTHLVITYSNAKVRVPMELAHLVGLPAIYRAYGYKCFGFSEEVKAYLEGYRGYWVILTVVKYMAYFAVHEGVARYAAYTALGRERDAYESLGRAMMMSAALMSIADKLSRDPSYAKKLDLEKLRREVIEAVGADPLRCPERKIGDFYDEVVRGASSAQRRGVHRYRAAGGGSARRGKRRAASEGR